MQAESAAPFEATNETGETGLVGTMTVKVVDNDGATPVGPTTANITEIGVSGVYVWNAPAGPTPLGQYTIMWSTDGSYDPDTVSTESLEIVAAGASTPSPIPSPGVLAQSVGPCTAWLTGDDVALCCNAEDVGTMYELYDDAADVASQLLYEASGRRWPGLCSRDGVRPCHGGCNCGFQVLSRGHIVQDPYLYPVSACEGRSCWCNDLSRVKLAGYAQEITQVKIDGAVLDASVYRLDEHKWLTRVDGGRWPSCAHGDRADTEDGTFSVSYTFGKAPPLAGIEAAKVLACQIYTRCSNSGDVDCAVPQGAVRITRQGITVERAFFRWSREGGWQSGMDAVDQFLNLYNPHGIPRRALFTGPGSRGRYARPVG